MTNEEREELMLIGELTATLAERDATIAAKDAEIERLRGVAKDAFVEGWIQGAANQDSIVGYPAAKAAAEIEWTLSDAIDALENP